MSNYLKKRLEDLLGVSVELSKVRTKYGDYSSNVFLKHKNLDITLLDPLLEEPLIESYTLINKHLNINVSVELMTIIGVPVETDSRMFEIFNRLYREGYTDIGCIPKEWFDLVKAFNVAFVSGEPTLDLVQIFNKLDQFRIYRNYNYEELCGIQNLLRSCLLLLERNSDE